MKYFYIRLNVRYAGRLFFEHRIVEEDQSTTADAIAKKLAGHYLDEEPDQQGSNDLKYFYPGQTMLVEADIYEEISKEDFDVLRKYV